MAKTRLNELRVQFIPVENHGYRARLTDARGRAPDA
jgi:hypothetical protein